MRHNLTAKIISLAVVAALAVTALAGCAQQSTSATEAQQANRTYMSQVNQDMDSLKSKLEDFNEAVSRKDVVTMQTQAQEAFKVIDDLTAIEAPEGLEDIQTDYATGATSLKDALNDYINLYTEISSATEANPFDWSTYDQRVADIQKKYDDGINSLQAGDKAAADKE